MIQSKDVHNPWSDIRSILARAFRQLNLDQDDTLDGLSFHWNLAVGREVAAVTRLEEIREGRLLVRVASREWVPALKALKGQIIREINTRSGEKMIRDIRFQEGPGTAPPSGASPGTVF